MTNPIEDLYVDYLISSFSKVCATDLSAMLDGAISHDKFTRWLAQPAQTSKDLWKKVKPLVRQIEGDDGVLIIDDSICEKPYTDESPLNCWHYDHCQNRSVKGINFLTALYHHQEVSLPVGVHLVVKSDYVTNNKTGKRTRKATFTKNQYCQSLLSCAKQNNLRFSTVLMDVWFASVQNLTFVVHELGKQFVVPIKTNRKIALSKQDQKQRNYQRVDSLQLEENKTYTIWLEGIDFPMLLVKQVFKNEDNSTGVLYLIASDNNLSYERITSLYQKRWTVECYHKSLKQNASLEKSPTKNKTTQANHFFASLYAYIKLEALKITTHLNHFALKNKLYIKAMQSAFAELRRLRNTANA